MYHQIIMNAIFSGVLSIIIGSIVNYILFSSGKIYQWSNNYSMEIALFFTGFFSYLLSDISGINRWFCKSTKEKN